MIASGPQPELNGTTAPKVRVMLVDDQQLIGASVRQMLDQEPDIEFHFCPDPARAIDMAHELRPTVILQDLVMPDVDGMMLVKFYRASPVTADTPVIVLSSKEDPLVKAQSFARGANDYLVKLPDRVELIARIRHHSHGYTNLLERNEAYEALARSRQKLQDQLQVAAAYLQSLLPPPVESPVAIDWRYVPSADLGGDVFGYDWIDEDHLAVYLLDVTGHGVDSALFAVSVMNVVRSRTLPDVDFRNPGQVLGALNDKFPMELYGGKTFTIWYGVYQPKTRGLIYAGGGHPDALLFSRCEDGAPPALQRLPSTGPLIGMMPWPEFENNVCEVVAGSTLYVYSDGAHEIQFADGTVQCYDDFLRDVTSFVAAGDNVMDRIIDTAIRLHGSSSLDDDLTMLELRF
jgi:sigma-B regulation protein RsbU (phosphoserine phosphatase)